MWCLFCGVLLSYHVQNGRHANALQLELDALAGLRGHPGVVQLLDVVEEEQTIHIVTELCDKGDLFDYLSAAVRLREDDARVMFRWDGVC